ncbi:MULTISPECIES: HEAT repeat domain-containing protein [Dehalococcoides]|jgi:HEAT repeat protein|uniref:HEAT repeat domain-containing protein n=1 Tax=Dehalococcoides TaxID=61434 RepID=UPI00006B29F3|nr:MULTISPECIES: HEAT repeat domain-containing protein [Dehalococcoides]AGG06161.1 PBS lyase HEAT-like repeat domain-containing protein [Dehalococcoides mccartyi DCMB5]AGG07593.1 PBS lyase HEAT-like repeat domain-containing protein [Dehalococcoides mccartyi BTF08]AQU05610.1 PBS lyase [Dehalococcoides mccartyi]AQU07056.1 PBS lyase [Dehalococcoides mccartyi]AQW62160.1 PBS lyase [Dehalococcoides mccartyi]
MSQENPEISELFERLADENTSLKHTDLALLSDLNNQEIAAFKDFWTGMSPERRLDIVSRLGELAEDDVSLDFDSIFVRTMHDPNPEVRAKSVDGLWECNRPSLVDHLLSLSSEDPSMEVRIAATAALGRYSMMGEFGQLPEKTSQLLQTSLLAIFKNTNLPVELRRRALESVSPFGQPQVITAISQAHNSPEHLLRVGAVYAMGQNASDQWESVITSELNNDNNDLRYEAAVAAGELGLERFIPKLVSMIEDPDMEVQLASIQALAKIGGQDAKKGLTENLESTSSQAIREMITTALTDIEADESAAGMPAISPEE